MTTPDSGSYSKADLDAAVAAAVADANDKGSDINLRDEPAAVEASGDATMSIEYEGDTYTVPATVDDWDIEALEAAERGQPAALLNAVLGPAQYAAFKRAHPKVRDLRLMSDRVAGASGFTEVAGK